MSGPGDFDFLIGRWTVAHRRLREPLTGREEWEEFEGTAMCPVRLFDGAANLDEFTFPGKGFYGLTLRLYEPDRDVWTLNWVDSRTGRLQLPITGRFDENGRGEFLGEDEYGDVRVQCRFIWSDISATNAHWEQAYARPDGSWETNWTMEFHR